jgi:dienelactone hydrolase
VEALITEFAIRRRRGRVKFIARVCLICIAVRPALCQTEKRPLPLVGQIADVSSEADSAQTYALYLPSTYTTARRWPIIYFFDPGGRGRRPLELYKDIAEKYGFVMAGSNNSRNFSSDESRSVNAIWLDTHRQFTLDDHLTYVSGFSGGARVAGLMALSCPQCQIAGVIANGAGYPTNWGGAPDKLLYFFAVGDADFNWPEVMTIRRDREDKGLPYRVRVFSGPHQWAPAAVMQDAVEWMILRAMQSGDRPPDAAFIDKRSRAILAEAEEAEKTNDAMLQFHAYRSLVSDFGGLRVVTEWERRLAAIKKSPALKAALKNEQEQIADQSSLEADVSEKFYSYISGKADDEVTLGNSIVQAMRRINDQAEHSRNEAKRLVSRRAFGELWVAGLESGQRELEARHFERAEDCFNLIRKVKDDPWPVLLLAETHAAAGNRKRAVKDLQEAVRRGLTDARVIESDDYFKVLIADSDFQRLVETLKKNGN